tara:strand:- start:705 stop:968 length:264 start_codon:yes stop_codon:yes gene_type:complete
MKYVLLIVSSIGILILPLVTKAEMKTLEIKKLEYYKTDDGDYVDYVNTARFCIDNLEFVMFWQSLNSGTHTAYQQVIGSDGNPKTCE